MDFELTGDQQAIVESANKLIRHHAGAARARALLGARGSDAYDHPLEHALDEGGFAHIARDVEIGPLGAALVLEVLARHAGLVAYGERALVAAAFSIPEPSGPVAIASARRSGPIRYGNAARTLVIVDADHLRIRPVAQGEARPVRSTFGYPAAHLPSEGGDRCDGDAADRARALWRVALAAEIAGVARAALDQTTAHVKERTQFGRPIGSFQALQHRLAECAVLVEGCRWLALEAAWLGAPPDAADAAAAYAALVAKRVLFEAQQLHGAMGLTREHDLHIWTMRLPALRIELSDTAAR